MIAVAAGIFVLGAVLCLTDLWKSETELQNTIRRNEYGKGSRIEELKVKVGEGKKMPIRVEISEQEYTSEEMQEVFRRCIRSMDQMILGDNEDADHVESDLKLLTQMPGEPINISWETDRYDVIGVNGELKSDALVPEGTKVMLKAVLTYEKDPKKQALYESAVVVYPPGIQSEEDVTRVEAAIQKADMNTRTENILELPVSLDGEPIVYYPDMKERGMVLMTMALLIGILLYALDIQKEGQEQLLRKRQMEADYPEIINKLTLFLGAGMTVNKAWKKIVQDYEEQEKVWGKRYAYEEMKRTCYEMGSGITEAESYVRFGRRCCVQEYVRMGALLSQNLRRGTKGLNQILRLEAMQAFENRKARAKQEGEKAGTKLLVPMFLMLAVVLVMVIVPAFLSIRL